MEINNSHPYSPRELILADFVPVSLSQFTIVSVYLSSSLAIAVLVWILSGWLSKRSKLDRLLMCWWAFTGLTHIIVEGYVVFTPEFYKNNTGFYMADLWKEYCKGDSRYASRDAGVMVVEAIATVLEGPASLLAIYAIWTNKPYSYVLQLVTSLGQLYGTALYFITAFLDGDNFAANSYYYYAYYITANASWVVFPTLISIRCWKKICASFQLESKNNKIKTR